MLPNVFSELQTFSLNGQSVIVRNTFVDVAEADECKLSHRRCKSVPSASLGSRALDDDAEVAPSDEPLHETRRRVFSCLSDRAQARNFDVVELISNASTQTPCSSISSCSTVGRCDPHNADNADLRVPLSLDSLVNGGLAFPATAPPAQETGNRTTLMFRNLPQHFTRQKLERLLKAEGFGMLYDFMYLPADLGTGSCFGYAFINMVTSRDAEHFVNYFQGFDRWPEADTGRALVHMSEALQGVQEQIERYRNSPLMHPSVSDELRPAVYTRGARVAFPEPTAPIRPPKVRTSTKKRSPLQK